MAEDTPGARISRSQRPKVASVLAWEWNMTCLMVDVDDSKKPLLMSITKAYLQQKV